MFERYTESARRALFFARYEVSQRGAASIEVEHLLLGVSRAASGSSRGCSATPACPPRPCAVRLAGESALGEQIPTSVEIPFSHRRSACCNFRPRKRIGWRTPTSASSTCCSACCGRTTPVAAAILHSHGVKLDTMSVRRSTTMLAESPPLAGFAGGDRHAGRSRDRADQGVDRLARRRCRPTAAKRARSGSGFVTAWRN